MTGTLPLDLEVKEIDAYNNTTYEYSPIYTVQSDVEIFITGGLVNTTATADSQLKIYLKEDNKIIATGFDDNGNNDDLSLTITVPNLSIKAGSTYKLDFLYTEGDNASPSTARIDTGSYWRATVENLAAQSTYYLDPAVYTQQNFPGNINEFSEYNSLLNNVYSNRVSSKYFDVDYNSDALTPTNFEPIISQSALYAQIQDSNYDPKSAFFELRYSGTKYTSQNYNVFTEGDAQKEPPIDYYTDWFAYYDWIGGSDPQYPGGGNFHITQLVNGTTGEIITLDTANNNLGLVESIFRQGDTPTQIITALSSSSTGSTLDLEIETGGALYQTILEHTSTPSPIDPSFTALYGTSNTSPVFVGFFANAGSNILMDTGSIYKPFLYPLITGSDPNLGEVRVVNGDGLTFYNKTTGQISDEIIPYQDTLLPLHKNDFIRFGDLGSSSSSSLDGSFEALGLYRIKEINIAATASDSSSLEITPALNADTTAVTTWGFGTTNQTCRIFRRIPNETFVITKQLPANREAGLLVPQNFNPDLDPLTVARGAGII